MAAEPTIEFFFDPACPWTWMTSRWLIEATTLTDREIRWRNLSLGVINAGREIPEKYRSPMKAAHRAHRIIAAMRADERNDEIGDYYTEWGRRFHHDRAEADQTNWPSRSRRRAVPVRGRTLPTTNDGTPTSRHRRRKVRSWPEVPTWDHRLSSSESRRRGFFGPIVSPPPSGDDAVALLDHVLGIAALPGFYELKRGRQGGPQFGPRP